MLFTMLWTAGGMFLTTDVKFQFTINTPLVLLGAWYRVIFSECRAVKFSFIPLFHSLYLFNGRNS